nr:MAG TPA: hypothetical protein [Caudoviricetes sp.]
MASPYHIFGIKPIVNSLQKEVIFLQGLARSCKNVKRGEKDGRQSVFGVF